MKNFVYKIVMNNKDGGEYFKSLAVLKNGVNLEMVTKIH